MREFDLLKSLSEGLSEEERAAIAAALEKAAQRTGPDRTRDVSPGAQKRVKRPAADGAEYRRTSYTREELDEILTRDGN